MSKSQEGTNDVQFAESRFTKFLTMMQQLLKSHDL